MPPDRNAPIGTSLTICMATDDSSRARTRSIHSRSVRSRIDVGRQSPVDALRDLAALDDRQAGRRQLADAAEDRLRRGYVAERKIGAQRAGIERRRRAVSGEQCLRFAREQQAAADFADVERLDPEPVAAEQQALPLRIPERERRTSR